MNTLRAQALQATIGALSTARPSERGELVVSLAERLGLSVARTYTILKEHGWSSGRKPRSDRGQSALDADATEAVAAILARGIDARGKSRTPVSEALAIARQQGLAPDISAAQACRVLRWHGLSREALTATETAVLSRSLHPNHVAFCDISPCAQWYFRNDEGGKMEPYGRLEAPYKAEQYQEIKRHILRYVATDHYTGAYFVRFYYAAGENSLDACDFLYRFMAEKSITRERYPLRGVPWMLVFDQGSAWKNGTTLSLLRGLGYTTERPAEGDAADQRYVHFHKPGNAKSSGSVETRHRHWQEGFETWLREAGGAKDLAELNTWAEQWSAAAQWERPHSRYGRAPMELWNEIATDELVEAPSREVFFNLATGKREERRCDGRNWVSYKGQWYALEGGTLYTGCKVQVEPSPFGPVPLRAWDIQGVELGVTAIVKDKAGFATNARSHVYGEVDGASGQSSPASRMKAAVEAAERPAAREIFGDLPERIDRIATLPREGRAWTAPTWTPSAAEPPMGEQDAREWVGRKASETWDRRLSREEWAWWAPRLAAPMTRSQLSAAWTEFAAPAAASRPARAHTA